MVFVASLDGLLFENGLEEQITLVLYITIDVQVVRECLQIAQMLATYDVHLFGLIVLHCLVFVHIENLIEVNCYGTLHRTYPLTSLFVGNASVENRIIGSSS